MLSRCASAKPSTPPRSVVRWLEKVGSLTPLCSVIAPLTTVETSSAMRFTSRARPSTEPTSATQPQWVAVLWTRLGRVVDDVANCCIKVYTLEKVLRIKKDPLTQTEFLDEVMKVIDATRRTGPS